MLMLIGIKLSNVLTLVIMRNILWYYHGPKPRPHLTKVTLTTPKLGPYQAPIIRRANWSGKTPATQRVAYRM